MAAYLYPNLKSKAAYKRALVDGVRIVARENTPTGQYPIENGTTVFEGPHYPEPHRFYGKATVVEGRVVKVC